MAEYTNSSCDIIKNTPNMAFIDNYDDNKFFFETCRTCSLAVKENSSTVFLTLNKLNVEKTLHNKLFLCCPELDLRTNSKNALCADCFKIIHIINKFIGNCSINNGQLNKNRQSIPNVYLCEDFTFNVKNEIKVEELDLSEVESYAETGTLCPISDTKYGMEKYNCKINIDGSGNCNSKQNKSFDLFHTEEISSKPLHLYNNFKKTSACDQRQCKHKCTVKNHSNYHPNSAHQIKLKNNCTAARKKPFNCSECDYSSKRKQNLITHIRIHTGEKPFKCYQCDYSSSTKGNLINHVRTHTGEKPFKCSQCNYSGKQKQPLIIHIRNHTGEKPFKCSQCNYSSKRKPQLTAHMRTHTGEKPFKCSHCNYRSKRKHLLKNHMYTHTGKKPFKCSYCDYSSTTKNCLKNHIRTHTGEKPFKCSQCNYSSKRKQLLINHIYTHTGEKPFKCYQCDYSSKQKQHLVNHMHTHCSYTTQ